jgi:hypothetical protein
MRLPVLQNCVLQNSPTLCRKIISVNDTVPINNPPRENHIFIIKLGPNILQKEL